MDTDGKVITKSIPLPTCIHSYSQRRYVQFTFYFTSCEFELIRKSEVELHTPHVFLEKVKWLIEMNQSHKAISELRVALQRLGVINIDKLEIASDRAVNDHIMSVIKGKVSIFLFLCI
jgi:hypothetical protein